MQKNYWTLFLKFFYLSFNLITHGSDIFYTYTLNCYLKLISTFGIKKYS